MHEGQQGREGFLLIIFIGVGVRRLFTAPL